MSTKDLIETAHRLVVALADALEASEAARKHADECFDEALKHRDHAVAQLDTYRSECDAAIARAEKAEQAIALAGAKPRAVFKELSGIADNCLRHLKEREAARAERDAALAQVAVLRKALIRSRCGCEGADCTKHGAYVPGEADAALRETGEGS